LTSRIEILGESGAAERGDKHMKSGAALVLIIANLAMSYVYRPGVECHFSAAAFHPDSNRRRLSAGCSFDQ